MQPDTENVDCPLCGASGDDVVVVGERARFNLPVRNVACRRCGLVYINPRPTQAALEAYYRTEYRTHYHGVKIPAPDGRLLGPEDEGFDEVWQARHRAQAHTALTLGQAPAGGRVLEVGCGDGTSLGFTAELGRVSVFGIEPDAAQAEVANARGIACFAGPMEAYAQAGEAFDQVQMFHVLEHLTDPLAALIRLSSWLKPGGRLVIEVPNVSQPYGLLEGNFFQNAHLFNFSPNTLKALFRRAGLSIVRVVDAGSLFVVGEVLAARPGDFEPLPFSPDQLDAPDEDGAWVAARLATYRDLERVRVAMLQRFTFEGVEACVGLLQRPAYPSHLIRTATDLTTRALHLGAHRVALTILDAAAAGPHRADIVQSFSGSAAQLRQKLASLPS